MDFAKLGPWVGASLNRQPLVPASLGHGKVTNEFVHVIIRDQSGASLYSLGNTPRADFAVTKPFGEAPFASANTAAANAEKTYTGPLIMTLTEALGTSLVA